MGCAGPARLDSLLFPFFFVSLMPFLVGDLRFVSGFFFFSNDRSSVVDLKFGTEGSFHPPLTGCYVVVTVCNQHGVLEFCGWDLPL